MALLGLGVFLLVLSCVVKAARRRWALQVLRGKRLDRTFRYQTQQSGELFGAARRLD